MENYLFKEQDMSLLNEMMDNAMDERCQTGISFSSIFIIVTKRIREKRQDGKMKAGYKIGVV